MKPLFNVFIKESLLGGATNFQFAKRLNVTSMRTEINGLGSCELSLDLPNEADSDEDSIDYWNLEGWWVFVTDRTKDDPTSISSNDFEWWGRIDKANIELARGFNDFRGTYSCSEVGNYLNQFPIVYGSTNLITIGRINESGFNPFLDGLWIGNKEIISEVDNELRRSDYGFELDSEVEGVDPKFWNIKEVSEYITKKMINTCPLPLELDFSLLNIEPESFLYDYETLQPFNNMTFGQILDQLLNPYGWYFDFESESYLRIRVVDRSGIDIGTSVIELQIDPSIKRFEVLDTSEVFDRVHLRGNRILVSGSLTTYVGDEEFHGVKPDFNSTDLSRYVRPFPHINYPNSFDLENDTQNVIDGLAGQGFTSDSPEGLYIDETTSIDVSKESIYNILQRQRKLDKRTYQSFKYKLKANGELYTVQFPGSENQGEEIPFFPRLSFQNLTELQEIFDKPVITTGSETPPLFSMKYEDFIPYSLPLNIWESELKVIEKLEPIMMYRVRGAVMNYGGNNHYSPAWYIGTHAEHQGVQGFKLTLNMDGFRVETGYPEVLGDYHDDIYRNNMSSSDSGSVDDKGLQSRGLRGEWAYEFRQASAYDPTANYAGKGHWGRMIISFSAYSNQFLEIFKGTLETENVKYIDDPSLEIWLLRRGLAARTTELDVTNGGLSPPYLFNAPEWIPDDIVVRNDMNKAKEKLDRLYEYYSREKRAIRIEQKILDIDDNFKRYEVSGNPLRVGQFINRVRDGSKWITARSHVASIEYSGLDTESPVMILTTEYPDSPVNNRQKIESEINGRKNSLKDNSEAWFHYKHWQERNK